MKTLEQIQQAINKYATANNIKSVQLFGSYADGTATNDSDIDLLVEYHQPPTLLNYLGFQEQLQNDLGIKVDILKYPIDQRKLLFPNFKINKTVPLYG
jgi:predicted nucleotidyltransferase